MGALRLVAGRGTQRGWSGFSGAPSAAFQKWLAVVSPWCDMDGDAGGLAYTAADDGRS